MPEDKLSPEQDSSADSVENGQDQFIPLPRRLVILTMAGIMLALFLASLDQTIVVTAMPRIIADLEGFDRFTWVTTSYLLTSTTVVPIAGKLTNMYGRYPVLRRVSKSSLLSGDSRPCIAALTRSALNGSSFMRTPTAS